MQTIKLHARSEADGTLRLEIPVGLRDTNLEIVLVVQPLPSPSLSSPEARGWPPRFFEETFGIFQSDPLERSE